MQESMDIDLPPTLPLANKVKTSRFKDVRPGSAPPYSAVQQAVVRSRQTGYVYDPTMMAHVHPTEDHPEQPERINIIYKEMTVQGLRARMKSLFFGPVTRQHAMLVHAEDHWDKVEQIANMTREEILESVHYYEGLSLYVSPDTTYAAKLSCGGVIEACKAVVKGEVKNSFAIVRPPGHHAEPDEHMGFCFFNNAAVAARVVQQELGVKKILILDWDVHHGNGTQKAFLDDPSVLYISLHRYDDGHFYPGGHFGALSSCGEGPGLGFSVNIGWPEEGMGDAEYLYAFQRIVMPIAMEFAPELVIISAGFDAARGDDLGGCDVTPAGYAHMTYMLSSLASGKVVVALEGGYNLESIRDSAMAVMRVLLGETLPNIPSLTANAQATETVYQVARFQSKYWKNIKAPSFDSKPENEVPILNFPLLIKQQRARELFERHRFVQIPFMDPNLKSAFDGLCLTSSNIFHASSVILFVHNFGDLHVELMGETTCNVKMERSYIMDASYDLISWAQQNQFGFIDLNVFSNGIPVDFSDSMRETLTLQRKVITYVWDNFIEVMDETVPVYLIAYGGAAFPISELFRAREVTRRLKGIAQIIGQAQQPATIRRSGEEVGWMAKNSVIYTGLDPHDSIALQEGKGLGRIQQISLTGIRGSLVMRKSIPALDELIKSGRPFGDPVPVVAMFQPPPNLPDDPNASTIVAA